MTERVALGYNFQGSWGDGLNAWEGGEGIGEGDDRKLVKVSIDELHEGKTPLIIIIISIRSVKAGQLQNMKVKITGNSKNYFRQSNQSVGDDDISSALTESWLQFLLTITMRWWENSLVRPKSL